MSGSATLIVGPMFSGKSTELIRRVKRHAIAKMRCIVFKYSGDTRYTNKPSVTTHDFIQYDAIPCHKLLDKVHLLNKYEVVGIDEAQFFPDVVEFTEKAANMGLEVIIAALDGTFQRKPFGRICDLLPVCENVVKLSAICAICYKPASFSKRIVKDQQVELIGSSDMYIPCCRKCFFAPTLSGSRSSSFDISSVTKDTDENQNKENHPAAVDAITNNSSTVDDSLNKEP